MNNGSNFYVSGNPMWNQKSNNASSSGVAVAIQNSTNSIESILCSDCVIDTVNMTLTITKNSRLVEFEINEIIFLATQVNIMTVFSGDKAPFWIFFNTSSDLVSVNTRLVAVMNGQSDPGC